MSTLGKVLNNFSLSEEFDRSAETTLPSDLKRKIPSISQKMLTQQLRELESKYIVEYLAKQIGASGGYQI